MDGVGWSGEGREDTIVARHTEDMSECDDGRLFCVVSPPRLDEGDVHHEVVWTCIG